jgi:hypothetical protein
VTLSAKPKISPYAGSEVLSSLSSSSSPPTEARGPEQKQQQTSPLPPALYSRQTSDPELPRFNEILAQCNANIVMLNPLGEQGQFQQPNQTDLDEVRQCFMALKQAVTKYCEDFETYDAAKRSYVNTPKIEQWLDAADRIVYFGTGLNILGQ